MLSFITTEHHILEKSIVHVKCVVTFFPPSSRPVEPVSYIQCECL